MRKIDKIIAAVGLTLFFWVATKIGWVAVARQLEAVPITLLILIGLSFSRLALQTHALSTALRAEGIETRNVELIGIRLAAQSIAYVSVLGAAISEPMKIRLLRKHGKKAVTPTLADTIVYGFSSALFGIAGCVCAGSMMIHSRSAASPAGLAVIFTVGLFLMARRGPLLPPLVRRLAARCPAWLRTAEQIEASIRQFRTCHQAPICRMFWLDVSCQFLLAGEVAVFLWALRIPFHATTILALEAASRAIKMMAGWMPARIGADETGTVAAFAALGLPTTSGLAFAFARRTRDLLACALGFGWLVWRARQDSKDRLRNSAAAGWSPDSPAEQTRELCSLSNKPYSWRRAAVGSVVTLGLLFRTGGTESVRAAGLKRSQKE